MTKADTLAGHAIALLIIVALGYLLGSGVLYDRCQRSEGKGCWILYPLIVEPPVSDTPDS